MTRMIAGIDEAGRGAVLGPLIIAAVAIEENRVKELLGLGVKDSKLLSRRARESLYESIKGLTDLVHMVELSPMTVDKYVLRGEKFRRLNYLEAIGISDLISKLPADRYYVDAPDVKPERFSKTINTILGRKVKIISSHHADRIYPVVSAASIVAKVERDSRVENLRQKFGPLGSGYPADKSTRNFLKLWLQNEKGLPPFGRSSWKTWMKLRDTRLDDYNP